MKIFEYSNLVNLLIGFSSLVIGIISILLILTNSLILMIIGILTIFFSFGLFGTIILIFIKRLIPPKLPFKIIEYHKVVTINNADGTDAHIMKKYKIQYLDPNIKQYIFKSIGAPGAVKNFKSNLKINKIGKYAGNHTVSVKIPNDKKKFDIFNVSLNYDVYDTFTELDTEYTILKIERITKKVEIEIKLSSNKTCSNSRAILCTGAGEKEIIKNKPEVNLQGQYIKWSSVGKTKLKIGTDIRIEWDWK